MSQLVAGLTAFLYFSYVYLYFFNAHLTPIRPVYLYAATLGVTVAMVAPSLDFKLPAPAPRRAFVWACVFMVLGGASFLWSSQSDVAAQMLVSLTESMLLLMAFLYLFRRERSLAAAMQMVALGTFVGVLMNVVDFFSIGHLSFTTVPGRAAGLYENSNISGNYLALGMIISAWSIPVRLRWWFGLLVGLGIVLTFSRSAMLMWGMGMMALAWFGRFSMHRTASVLVTGGMLVVAGIFIVVGRMVGLLEALGLRERLTVNTMNRMTGSFFGQIDESTQGRLLLIKQGFHEFLRSPLLGNGLGTTEEWLLGGSTHNMYIMLLAEMGIVGFSAYLALIWLLWSGRTPLATTFAAMFALSSMFTHGSLTEPAMMVLVAIVASYRGEIGPASAMGRSRSVNGRHFR